jgi:hypothetical protein
VAGVAELHAGWFAVAVGAADVVGYAVELPRPFGSAEYPVGVESAAGDGFECADGGDWIRTCYFKTIS